MLVTLAMMLLTQARAPALGSCGPEGPIFCSTQQLAFFEFAPASGVGMGTACACTAPTGAKGEAMTFTRASSGTCLKGNTATGIANGDLVTCATDQSRVMPGGDGSGGLGLMVEAPRTNGALRSQEIDNPAWLKVALGIAAPTVAADFAVAPDGTATAERVQFAAANVAQVSSIDQASLGTSATAHASSCFLKGNGTSGTVDFAIHNGGAWSCTTCNYTASTWTRCQYTVICNGAGQCQMSIGNNGSACASNRAAQDVLLWGCGFETGAFASSYIATTSAAATRAVDAAYFPWSTLLSTGSIAATVMHEGTAGLSEISFASLQDNTPNYDRLLVYISANAWRLYSTAGVASLPAAAPVAGVATRFAGDWSGTTGNVYLSGSTASAVIAAAVSQLRLTIGAYGVSSSPAFGVVKQVCVDRGQGRCR